MKSPRKLSLIINTLLVYLFFFPPYYSPAAEGEITQGEFIYHLVKVMNLEAFLPENPQIEDYIKVIESRGITVPGGYKPDEFVTSRQMAVMLIPAMGLDKAKFEDTKERIGLSYINKAVIVNINGNVEVKLKETGEWKTAKPGFFLGEEDIVKTDEDSSAIIRIGQFAVVTVKENTTVAIYQLTEKSIVYLDYGEIIFDTSGTPRKSRHTIITPTTIAAVRGTVIRKKYEPLEDKTIGTLVEGSCAKWYSPELSLEEKLDIARRELSEMVTELGGGIVLKEGWYNENGKLYRADKSELAAIREEAREARAIAVDEPVAVEFLINEGILEKEFTPDEIDRNLDVIVEKYTSQGYLQSIQEGQPGAPTPASGANAGASHEESTAGKGAGPVIDAQVAANDAKQVTAIPTEPTVATTTTTTTTTTSTPTPSSTDRYVNADSGSDSNDGKSASTAWKTIVYALTQVSGTNIYVTGTFSIATQGSMPITITGRNNLGFIEYWTAVFNGSDLNQVFTISNSTDIAFFDVTFENGDVNGSNGAGISISNSSVYFKGCNIEDNDVINGNGGGIYADSSTIAVVDCIITENDSTFVVSGGNGGGIYMTGATSTLTDTFTFNSTTYINSYGTTTFTKNTASGNTGGGVICMDGGTLNFTNGNFTFGGTNPADANTITGGNGCGIAFSNSSTFTLANATFRNNNTGVGNGGAIGVVNSSGTIYNCLFVSNTANNGAAIYCDGSSPNIYYCTFSSNTAISFGRAIALTNNSDPTVKNCILHHDSGILIRTLDAVSMPQVTYCDVYKTAPLEPLANHDGAPLWNFVDFATSWGGVSGNNCTDGNPQLKADYNITNPGAPNPCVGGGNTIAGITNDINNNARKNPPDIGCFESSLGDPPITGRVYDSVTGTTISSPTIAIYKSTSTTALSTTTSNPYTFNVDPGSYYIVVSKSGYGFPSQIIESTTAGDHGDIFTVYESPLGIDIPMDPDGWLYVEKTVNKKRVSLGDIVTYNIKIQNKHWYEGVENVELVDEIVNGFKYVDGSTYRGSAKQDDPVVSGHKAVFNIGTVSANSTMNISYQVRVGVGVPDGRYSASANTRKSTTKERNSNISSASIEVVEDPLFTRGTIIGKVFYDVNGNGWQDTGENGIQEVLIATEYGVVVKTDKDGKYHIKDVPEGNHLLKVDPATLPSAISSGIASASPRNDSWCFTTDNPYFVKVTEGLPAKVNFGVTPLTPPSPQGGEGKGEGKFFIVALGEGIVRNLNTSGNIEMVEKDDRFDDGLHVDGRLAFYLKGKVLGKYLITASVDTERRPYGRYDSRRLFRNLDPDKYYPVYGDASKVDYSAVDTQDIAYVMIEWDESFAKWGSFHTNLPLYNRTISGGIVDYKSVGKTKFGDSWTEVKGFGAVSRQKPAHDEFVGTGGSLYYLKHQDVIEGSEKIRVEVRDRVSKTTLSSIPLAEEKDYEIDYDTGRLLLKRPLNSVQQIYTGSIISNDILMGERVYLIIDYEYYSDSLSDQAWGGRVSQWAWHHIRVGGTYVEEQKPGDNYKVYGGDATVKINEDTEIKANYNHSEDTQLGSTLSYDGGLTFQEQLDTFSDGEKGDSYSVDARTKLFKNTDAYVMYSKQDPYYSATDSISQQGSEKYIANVIVGLTETLTAGINHITQKYLAETTATSTFGEKNVHTTTGLVDYRKDKWDLRAEYQHQEVKNPTTNYTYFGTIPLLDNDFIAGRIGYQLFNWLHPYIRGQITVSGEANDQGSVGVDMNIWEKTTLNIAETVGTQGNSTLVGLTSKVTEDTDVYANLEVGNHMQLGRFAKTTYGQSTQLGPDSRAYIEEDYSSYRENLVRGNILGYDKKITDTLALGLTYERSNVENNPPRRTVIDRDAGSVKLAYLNPDWLEGSSKLEVRNDSGGTEVRQWVTQNDLLWRATEGITLSGRCNWGWTTDLNTEIDKAEFYEIGTGFSLRPVSWDRLNLLGKYSYILNLPPDSQWDFIENMESRRHVYGLEGIYDICRYLQLVGKFAYRDLEEKVGYRDWMQSDTYLYIARTNFHIMNKDKDKPFILRGWDLGVEYRVLTNDQIEDEKDGFLVELDKDIGNYLRMGVGYNFTDYDDNLRDEDDWDAKGWFIRVNGKY